MNAPTRIDGSTAVATDAGNPFAAYGQAQTQRTIVGDLLKFSKGEFLVGQAGDEMPEGTRLVANMDELLIGWIKWTDGAPSEHEMGRLVDGYTPPKRRDLGDLDQGEWETDTKGNLRDPWQFSNYLLMKSEEGDSLYTFSASSRGSLNAIGELCKFYGKEMRQRPDEYPVVALKVSSYRHSNKEIGKVKIPILEVVGWAPKSDFTAPMAAVVDGGNGDDEGNENKPENGRGKPAQTKAKTKATPTGKTRF